MAKSAGRKQVFILGLLGLIIAGVALLVFRDIPITQTEQAVKVNHAGLAE